MEDEHEEKAHADPPKACKDHFPLWTIEIHWQEEAGKWEKAHAYLCATLPFLISEMTRGSPGFRLDGAVITKTERDITSLYPGLMQDCTFLPDG